MSAFRRIERQVNNRRRFLDAQQVALAEVPPLVGEYNPQNNQPGTWPRPRSSGQVELGPWNSPTSVFRVS